MIAALYIDEAGPYASMPDVDPWGESRDATRYTGPHPVVAHPPCGPWSRLAHFCGPELLAQKGLAPIAVEQVRRWGGVLEHPAHSALWAHCNLPRPGEFPDRFGGWTLEVEQWWWGHTGIKPTWFYIVGVGRSDVRLPTRDPAMRPDGRSFSTTGRGTAFERLAKSRRHITPPALVEWLVDLASRAKVSR